MNLIQYVFKRLVAMVPTLLGITALTFLLINLAPGSPIDQKLEKMKFGSQSGSTTSASAGMSFQGQSGISKEVMDALKKQYGFDKPLYVRYWMWLKNLFRLDFGKSEMFGRPVLETITERFPVSLQFGLTSLLLTYTISVALGAYMAKNVGKAADHAISFLLIALAAVPPFVCAITLIVLFAGGSFLDIFPLGYLQSEHYELLSPWEKVLDRIHHFTLPLACYMAGAFTSLAFLSKNSLLGEIRKDYVRTARAFGFGERTLFMKHALRNALIPIVTGIGGFLACFLAGSLLIETIFQLDGIGLLGYRALVARDYNLIMGPMFLQSLALLLGNLVGDLIYMAVDPRIDFTAEAA